MNLLDIQVNGYAGVDFNCDDLSAEDMHRACEALQREGVRILAAVVTDHLPVMQQRLARIAALRERDALIAEVVAGFHIEGPFLNPADGWRGAHPLDAVRSAEVDTMRRLLDAAGGLTRIVTLAPECDANFTVTRMLSAGGVTVSAGHCNPTLPQLDAAIDAGLSMFTHLGNGCPLKLERHDNIVQRALSRSDRLWLCFIADGVHVAIHALRNYFRAAGLERCIVVSDAMSAAGLGPGRFTTGRWTLDIGPDLVARSPDGSHLVGSAMNLAQAVERLRSIDLSDTDILQLTCDNPHRAVGLAM